MVKLILFYQEKDKAKTVNNIYNGVKLKYITRKCINTALQHEVTVIGKDKLVFAPDDIGIYYIRSRTTMGMFYLEKVLI